MRSLLIILTIYGALWSAHGQGNPELSLEDCISYALENNEQLKIKQLEKDIADAEVRKTIGLGLPQATINGGLNYNFEPQKSLIDISTLDPSVPAGTEQEVSFVQEYDGNLGLTVNQLLFDGSYFVGLQAARTFRELSSKEHVKTQIDVVEAVSKAYYNALIANEQVSLLERNLSRLDTLLMETDQMYLAGFAEKLDVDRIRVSHNNLKVEYNKSVELQKLSLKILKFQMGMNLSDPVTLSDNLNDVDVKTSLTNLDGFEYGQRIEMSQLETNKNLAFLDMKNYKSQRLPKLYARFGYGWNTATSRSGQLFESGRWLDNGVIGVTASIPVFDGLRKRSNIQQNRIQIEQIESQMSFTKKSIDLEIAQSQLSLSNQIETLNVQEQNMSLAQDVYDVSKVKYQEGVGSNIEVINADTSLKEAQTNYLNSLYQAITSQIELKKALGILYKN